MFTIEDERAGIAHKTGHRVIDHERGARLELINGSARSGQDLFLLTWQEYLIPLVTFRLNAEDHESGEFQVHIHIQAFGDSRYARNCGLKASALSNADRFVAHRLAAEALLVFGSWYDGLSFPDSYFVVRDATGGENLTYTLSSFGYSAPSRPPNYHSKLEWTEESIRRQAVEDCWGLDVPDAVFVIVLHNRRRAGLAIYQHMEISVPELFPEVGTQELEELADRSDKLLFAATAYGHAHLDGEERESVLVRMRADSPGFSRDTYRRALAYGTLLIQGNRDNEKRRRNELIESARSAGLLDGVFALLYFNWRYSKSQFLGPIPIHETLGDLHSREDLDSAVARAVKLIKDGGRFAWAPEGTRDHVERLTASHPGFSMGCVQDALDWGYLQNR